MFLQTLQRSSFIPRLKETTPIPSSLFFINLFIYFSAGQNLNEVFLKSSCSNCPNEGLIFPFSSCPTVSDPMCGTNNVTYNNFCEFANAQCQAGGTFYKQSIALCQGKPRDTLKLFFF